MIKNIIDNRTYKNTSKCDSLIFKKSRVGSFLLQDCDIVACYESIEIDDLLQIAASAEMELVVIIYDLNSKPLK